VLHTVKKVTRWEQIEGHILARVTHVEDEWLGVSSGGRWRVIPIDKRSFRYDRQGYTIVGAQYHGEWFSAEIDPNALDVEVTISVPHWSDKPEWRMYTVAGSVSHDLKATP